MHNDPHVKFELNQRLDEEMMDYFFVNSEPRAGFSFVDEIIAIHPAAKPFISLANDKQKEAIKTYVANFYTRNKQNLIESSVLFQKIWNEVEDQFFSESAKIFDCPWPEGKYVSYISILPIGPRFLDNKTFQTCWLWKDNLKGQVIHEMLHFQFFNLANILGLDKTIDENELWELSEIFNDIVQSEPKFVAIQGYVPKPGYPEHEQKKVEYKTIWNKNRSLLNFLKTVNKNLS